MPPALDGALLRGSVWYVRLDPIVGSELAKTRPCVVVQRDAANHTSPTTIVCPMVSAHGRNQNIVNVAVPTGEGGTTVPSLVRINQIRIVDRDRLTGSPKGRLSAVTMAKVDQGLRAILDLGE